MTFLLVFVLATLSQAQTFTTLYNFAGGSDGAIPWSAVIQDQDGNLYGTTWVGGDLHCGYGGNHGCGVAYKLNPDGTETVLQTFSGPNGVLPISPVIRDSKGTLYGTTSGGGGSGSCPYQGCGTVFKIDSAGKEKMLYRFTGGLDGCWPMQGLVRDSAGNFYGTTSSCGSSNYGTIFRVDSAGHFTLLHTFTAKKSDGQTPGFGHLLLDECGNLYGVTSSGGANDAGVLYELSRKRRFIVLHSFDWGATDGCNPWGSVAQDKAGNLYGTTYYCGFYQLGTIWKVSKKGTETILHNFAPRGVGKWWDGDYPQGGVTLDSNGNLYGVTLEGGTSDDGALYELSAKGRYTLLHSFDGSDGGGPAGEVLWTAEGTLFGTANIGGTGYCDRAGCGTVWKYVP